MKNHPAIVLKITARLLDVSALRFDLTVDLSAPRAEIMRELEKVLRPFIPYRAIDPRIFQAVDLIEREGLGRRRYVDASIKVFGTAKHADKIRNWYNKLYGGR